VCSSHDGIRTEVSGNATISTCWAAAFSSQAMTFFVVADGLSQYGRAWAAAMRIVRFPFQTEVARVGVLSEGFDSSALPAGSGGTSSTAARLSGEAQVGFDDERRVSGTDPLGQGVELRPISNSRSGERDVMTVDRIRGTRRGRREMP